MQHMGCNFCLWGVVNQNNVKENVVSRCCEVADEVMY